MPIPGLAARRFTSTAIDIVEQMCPRAAERGMATGCTERTAPMLALWSLLRWERKSGWSHWSGWGSRSTRWLAMRTGGCLRRVRSPASPSSRPSPRPCRRAGGSWTSTPRSDRSGGGRGRGARSGSQLGRVRTLVAGRRRLASPELGELLSRHGVVYDRLRQSIVAVLQSGPRVRVVGPNSAIQRTRLSAGR